MLGGTGSFLSFGSRGSKTSELEAYGSVGTLFAAVGAIAEAAAKQPWYMERVSTNARRVYGPYEPARRQIVSHPALDLWNSPNPYYSRHELVETWVQHVKLTGEAYGVIVTDPRFPTVPMELWPVRPDRMLPVPSTTKYLAGYVYTGPGGEKIPLEPRQVIQIKTPNPLDTYRGLGPVQPLLVDLDSYRLASAYNRKFFANDATPGGIIETDRNIPDGEFEKFRERWHDQHRGVNNAHRVALLQAGMRWVQNAFTPKDIQFGELRKVSSDAIREALRVHPAILGQSADVNRANAEAADFQLANWNVDPALSRIAGALNRGLLPLYMPPGRAPDVELCYESAVPEDQAAEDAHMLAMVNAFKTLTDAGVAPDSAAATVGLPPVDMAADTLTVEPDEPPMIEPTEDAA
jgi:HK97 family phage portal protein